MHSDTYPDSVAEDKPFRLGNRVRVSFDSERWAGAVGRIGIPRQLSRRVPNVAGEALTPFVASPHRPQGRTRLWWVEFEEPFPGYRETDRGREYVSAGEVRERLLAIEA
jgi:hypothetical protein